MFRKIYQNDFCEKVHLSTRGILGNMEEIEEEIEELILKRYAKRPSSNSTKGKTWYLLHYGPDLTNQLPGTLIRLRTK